VKPVTTLFSAAVLSSLIASGASGQTPEAAALSDVGRLLVASNNLKLSADAERSSSFLPTLVKQFVIPYAGVVRVSLELKSSNLGAPVNARVTSQIDNHCVASTMSTTYATFTCNVRVVAGDMVEVRVESVIPAFFGFVKNVRMYYNILDSAGVGKTLLN
jgi:hypothetical protein